MTEKSKYLNIHKDVKEFCTTDPHRRSELREIHNDGDFIVATNGHILVEVDLNIWKDLEFGKLVENFPDWKDSIPSIHENMMVDVNWVDLFTDSELFRDEPDNPDDYLENTTLFDCIKINGICYQAKYMNVISTLFIRLGFQTGRMWIPRDKQNKSIPAIFIQPGMGLQTIAMHVAENTGGINVLNEIEIY